jgi:hypothetical protein
VAIHTKKDGRIFCVYYDSGRQIWESFGRGHAAKKAAEARDLDIKLKKKLGQFHRRPRFTITFQELAQQYLNERAAELAVRTQEEIARSLVRYVLPYIGHTKIDRITLADWHRIQQGMLRAGVSAGTVNNYAHYATKILTWAVRHASLHDNPWRNREPLRDRRRPQIQLISLEEFQAISATAAPHVSWAMEVAYYTGVRPGRELFGLRYDNVNWSTGGMRIYAYKTESWRWQYPAGEFMERLEHKQGETRADYPDCPWIVHY